MQYHLRSQFLLPFYRFAVFSGFGPPGTNQGQTSSDVQSICLSGRFSSSSSSGRRLRRRSSTAVPSISSNQSVQAHLSGQVDICQHRHRVSHQVWHQVQPYRPIQSTPALLYLHYFIWHQRLPSPLPTVNNVAVVLQPRAALSSSSFAYPPSSVCPSRHAFAPSPFTVRLTPSSVLPSVSLAILSFHHFIHHHLSPFTRRRFVICRPVLPPCVVPPAALFAVSSTAAILPFSSSSFRFIWSSSPSSSVVHCLISSPSSSCRHLTTVIILSAQI